LEIHQWLDAIENHTRPVVEPYQMVTGMRIIEALYRSAETGQAVMIDADSQDEQEEKA
jgi:predicted dehydrogenase